MKLRMIDPPAGADYGFPKPFDLPDGVSLDEWLLQNGYPQAEVEKWPGGVPCRIYCVDDDQPV